MNQQLMIFELDVNGHHPGYLRHLLQDWPEAQGQLTLVVSPQFMQYHMDVVQTETHASVTWLPITQAELQWYETSKPSPLRRTWVEWRLFCRYARKVQADQGLMMYLDRFQLPLALRLFLPCQMSGIFFRPKFHYSQFSTHRPRQGELLRAWRETLLWHQALRHPQLQSVLVLDPLAVAPLQALGGAAQVVALPDPVTIEPPAAAVVATLCHELGLDPERKVLLLFGMIDRRKGIYKVLEALQQLSAAQQARLTLLLVGKVAAAEQPTVRAKLAAITQTTALQIVLRDEFVPDSIVAAYFALSDLVLALYQQHVGSSGILLWAAAAGKPVLASDYGLIGELVQRHHLGVAVDSTAPADITAGIIQSLEHSPATRFIQDEARNFAAKHQASAFTKVVATALRQPGTSTN